MVITPFSNGNVWQDTFVTNILILLLRFTYFILCPYFLINFISTIETHGFNLVHEQLINYIRTYVYPKTSHNTTMKYLYLLTCYSYLRALYSMKYIDSSALSFFNLFTSTEDLNVDLSSMEVKTFCNWLFQFSVWWNECLSFSVLFVCAEPLTIF